MSTFLRAHRSWALVALVTVVVAGSCYGLFVASAYPGVTPLQRETWRAQDAVNLGVALLLVWGAARSAAGSARHRLTELGLLAWLAYCSLHLAVGAAFGPAFPLYLASAGLAGFGFLDGLVRSDLSEGLPRFPQRTAAVFLAVAGIGIAGLWLSEIVPGLTGAAAPANLHLGGLPNPTWVLDLLWLIPWSLAAAWHLWRRSPAAPLVTIPLLVLLAALSVAMLLGTPFALAAGLGADPVVAPLLVVFTVVFGVLGGIEAALLARAFAGAGGVRVTTRAGWWQPAAEPADARVDASTR